MSRAFALTISLGLSLLAPAALADGMRCGTKLVRDGQRTSDVLAACGEPTSKLQRVAPKTGVTTDVWTYDFGPNEFVRILSFEDDRLISITTGEYGSRRR